MLSLFVVIFALFFFFLSFVFAQVCTFLPRIRNLLSSFFLTGFLSFLRLSSLSNRLFLCLSSSSNLPSLGLSSPSNLLFQPFDE